MRSLALLGLVACGGAPAPPGDGGEGGSGPPPACSIALEAYAAGGSFVPVEPGAAIGVIQGFQGFVYSLVRVRAEAEIAVAQVRIDTSVEGGSPATGHVGVDDPFGPEGGGSRSDDLMVFFNDAPYGMLLGRRVRLDVHLLCPRCEARTGVEVVLEAAPEPEP